MLENTGFLFALHNLRRGYCHQGSNCTFEHFPYQRLSGRSDGKQSCIRTMQGVSCCCGGGKYFIFTSEESNVNSRNSVLCSKSDTNAYVTELPLQHLARGCRIVVQQKLSQVKLFCLTPPAFFFWVRAGRALRWLPCCVAGLATFNN